MRSIVKEGEGRYCDAYEHIRRKRTANSRSITLDGRPDDHHFWYCPTNHGTYTTCSILHAVKVLSETEKEHLPVNISHIILDQEVEDLADWQPFDMALDLAKEIRRYWLVTNWIIIAVIAQTHLYSG